MAVLQMQRITICALKRDRKQLLEYLQRRGVIEITNEISEDEVFHKMDVNVAVSLLEKGKRNAEEAIRILNEMVPVKKSMLDGLNGRSVVSKKEYDEFAEKSEKVSRIVSRIVQIEKQLAESKAELIRMSMQSEMLLPWVNLDVPLNFKGTKKTIAYIGSIPGEWSLEQIYAEISEIEKVTIDIIFSSKTNTNVFILCEKTESERAIEKLREMGFAYQTLQTAKAPKEMEAT